MHILVIEHANTKSTKYMIQKVSIVQNDHTTMVIIKTCNRTHKNKNCGKNYEIQVQKTHKTENIRNFTNKRKNRKIRISRIKIRKRAENDHSSMQKIYTKRC